MLAYGREGFDDLFHNLFCFPDAFHCDFNSRLLRAEFGIRTKSIQLIRADVTFYATAKVFIRNAAEAAVCFQLIKAGYLHIDGPGDPGKGI